MSEISEADRKAFEEAAFGKRFLASIRRVGTGCMTFQSTDCPTQEEFTKRDADGEYVDPVLSAMWWGWREGVKHSRQRTAAEGDEVHVHAISGKTADQLWMDTGKLRSELADLMASE